MIGLGANKMLIGKKAGGSIESGQIAVASQGSNIFLSTNYCQNWTQIGTAGFYVYELAVSHDGQYILAANQIGNTSAIYFSGNYGASWSNVLSGISKSTIAMSCDGQYMIAFGWGDYAYASTDYGANWAINYSFTTSYYWIGNISITGQYGQASYFSILRAGDDYTDGNFGSITGVNDAYCHAISESGYYRLIGATDELYL